MDTEDEPYIGYLKYSGETVREGYLDARKSAEALLGFDEILRYFISIENPELKDIDYEIPVRVKKGTWGIWIPVGMAGLFALRYLDSVAKKAGTDGLFETGPAKDVVKIFRGAVIAGQWTVKIAKHVRSFTREEIGRTAKIIASDRGETIIGVPNVDGEILNVPKKYFDIYIRTPENLFAKNASLIEPERRMEFGVFYDDKEEKVSVSNGEREIFYRGDEAEEEVLFPELKHGQFVELEGAITRGNEKSNTIGFEYMGHILTCKPKSGNIATYKNKIISQMKHHFFPPVKLIGVIDRTDENHLFTKPRPQVIFEDIIPLETSREESSLF